MDLVKRQSEPSRQPAGGRGDGVPKPARHGAAVVLMMLALAAQELSARHANFVTCEAAWAAAPVVAVAIAADPHVARPTELPGDCDFMQRFFITNEVTFHRGHVLAISLLGGLHGP